MNFFNTILHKSKSLDTLPEISTEPNTIYAPFAGKVIPLKEINDGVFSAGILGQGLGFCPDEETVYAPFDGKIVQIADTKHAIGIQSKENIELLIHVGMDTVAMNGKGFQLFVSEGDDVCCGQKLMTFSKKAIADAGYKDTTAVVITNSADYHTIIPLSSGIIERLAPVLLAK